MATTSRALGPRGLPDSILIARPRMCLCDGGSPSVSHQGPTLSRSFLFGLPIHNQLQSRLDLRQLVHREISRVENRLAVLLFLTRVEVDRTDTAAVKCGDSANSSHALLSGLVFRQIDQNLHHVGRGLFRELTSGEIELRQAARVADVPFGNRNALITAGLVPSSGPGRTS